MTDTPTRWRKQPVTIDAVQYRLEPFNAPAGATANCFSALPEWLKDALCARVGAEGWAGWQPTAKDPLAQYLQIVTKEGTMMADVGDWIIRGVKGEIYPCKPDIFEATYVAADEPGSSDDLPPDTFALNFASNDVYRPTAEQVDQQHRHTALHLAVGDPSAPTPRIVERAEAFRAFLAGQTQTPPQPPSGYPAHVDRMIDEYRQLNAKWQALGRFFEQPAWDGVPNEEAQAMGEQHDAMFRYAQILLDRLNRAGVSKEALI